MNEDDDIIIMNVTYWKTMFSKGTRGTGCSTLGRIADDREWRRAHLSIRCRNHRCLWTSNTVVRLKLSSATACHRHRHFSRALVSSSAYLFMARHGRGMWSSTEQAKSFAKIALYDKSYFRDVQRQQLTHMLPTKVKVCRCAMWTSSRSDG